MAGSSTAEMASPLPAVLEGLLAPLLTTLAALAVIHLVFRAVRWMRPHGRKLDPARFFPLPPPGCFDHGAAGYAPGSPARGRRDGGISGILEGVGSSRSRSRSRSRGSPAATPRATRGKSAKPVVVVTGGCGLIGGAIVRQLAAAGWCHVLVLDKTWPAGDISVPGVTYYPLDICSAPDE